MVAVTCCYCAASSFIHKTFDHIPCLFSEANTNCRNHSIEVPNVVNKKEKSASKRSKKATREKRFVFVVFIIISFFFFFNYICDM